MHKKLKNLKLKEVGISSRGVRHVRFQQMHDGIPVFEGDYQVHIRPDGRVDMANGHYYPDIQVSNNASISAKSAIQKAQSDLGADKKLQREPETKKMIYRQSQKSHEANFVLAWKVLLEVKDGYWQYFVDAGSGQIIDKFDLSTTVTGDGNVISETTCTTPNSINTDLYRLNGSGYLSGNYANVKNDETSRAYSSTNSFQYSQSNTHFDEVNVYRHIDIYRATYVDNLGFNKNIGSDQDLEALVHYQGGGAAYYPSNEQVRFGDQIDYALQDEVIYHEFIHAMADAENGSHYLDPNPSEEGAIGEGMADYFPGSYTGDSRIGDCVLSTPRDMINPTYSHYDNLPKDQNGDVYLEEHAGGEFFSAILWDLRNASGISSHDADILVFEAISRLSGGPNFMEFRDAMMAVDSNINGGVHNDLIQNTFAARGIGNFTPLEVTITGPTNINAGEYKTWNVSASDGSGSYSYTWYQKPNTSSNWSQIGTGTSESTTDYQHFKLKVEVTDNGGPKTGSSKYPVFVQGYHP